MTSATCNEPYFFLLKWIKWKDELYTPSSSLEKLSDDFLNIENCPGHIWFVFLAPTILQVILLWGRKHEAKRCTVCSYGTYRWGRNKTQQSWSHQEESDRSIHLDCILHTHSFYTLPVQNEYDKSIPQYQQVEIH